MSAPTAKLSFEIAQLRRLKFGKRSEQLDAEQRALFDEALDADLAAAEAQLQELLGKKKPPATPGAMPKRTALPADLPRVDRHHEPENTAARAAVRSSASVRSWTTRRACSRSSATSAASGPAHRCRTLTQAPVPAEIIAKGIPTSGLLA